MSLKWQPTGSINAKFMQSQQSTYLGNLASELKLAIFSKLASFDDYSRMKATNKELRDWLQDNELFVLKGIIFESPTYVHDVKLSKATELNRTFAGYRYPVSEIVAASRLSVAAFNTLFRNPTAADFSPRKVYAVVERWNVVKVLADVYRRPALNSDFATVTLPYVPPTVDGSTPYSSKAQDFHHGQQPSVISQLKVQDGSHRRFYQAASALWMLSETIKLANTIQYAKGDEYKEVRQSLKTALVSLDVKGLFVLYEVKNFVYGFVMPKLFAHYATSWSAFCRNVANELGDRVRFRDTWKRTMKTLRLAPNPAEVANLLSCHAQRSMPINVSRTIRGQCAFGLRESNLIGRITNVGGLGPREKRGGMDFDGTDLRRCVANALHEMPAYEHISKSALSAGWTSFVTDKGFGSWNDRVHGQLVELEEDWEDYRLEGFHAHIMAAHDNELAVKERRKQERKATIQAARAAEIAANSGAATEDGDEMDID